MQERSSEPDKSFARRVLDDVMRDSDQPDKSFGRGLLDDLLAVWDGPPRGCASYFSATSASS